MTCFSRPTALISPSNREESAPRSLHPKIPQECVCLNSNKLEWKTSSEMTTLERVYLVSTSKCYAEVHPCQKKKKKKDKPVENKKGNVTTLQALLLLVSCTLNTSEEELPLQYYLMKTAFLWLWELFYHTEDLVPKYQWKLWILGLCRWEQIPVTV